MKKNVFLAMALLALMAVGAFAQTYNAESEFTVTKTATAVTITGYVGTGVTLNVSIPPKIQNLPVTAIGNNAFAGNTKLTSITIPEGVYTIRDGAFMNTGLTSITLPKTVDAIGNMAFQASNNLVSVTFNNNILVGNFGALNPFEGDLRDKFFATNKASGTPGTYTRPNNKSGTWTLQHLQRRRKKALPRKDFVGN